MSNVSEEFCGKLTCTKSIVRGTFAPLFDCAKTALVPISARLKSEKRTTPIKNDCFAGYHLQVLVYRSWISVVNALPKIMQRKSKASLTVREMAEFFSCSVYCNSSYSFLLKVNLNPTREIFHCRMR